MPRIGARIKVEQALGTVRFVGTVHGTPGEWLGVEWDDPDRGKHSGTHQGTVYFECRGPTSGSFMRYHPQKVIKGVTFLDALTKKYRDDDNVTTWTNGDLHVGLNKLVKVEMVGLEKVHQQQQDVSQLAVIGLENTNIASAGCEGSIAKECLAVQDLDLSSNLLPDWVTVADIACQLPSLLVLRLNYCRLELPLSIDQLSRNMLSPFARIEMLSLYGTCTSWSDVLFLAPLLLQLEDLQLGGCGIRHLSHPQGALGQLACLSLENNQIDSWDEIAKLGHLSQLKTLLLNGNKITSISVPEPGTFGHLEYLRIDHNQLCEWSSFNALDKYTALRNLRCNRNPLFDGMNVDVSTSHLVGRIGRVQTLNGSLLTARERIDYERYYLKQCATQGESHETISIMHPRYKSLCQAHGEPRLENASTSSTAVLENRLTSIQMVLWPSLSIDASVSVVSPDTLGPMEKTVDKRVLGTMLVRNARQLILKLFRIPAADRRFFLLQPLEQNDKIMITELTDDLRTLSFYHISAGDRLAIV